MKNAPNDKAHPHRKKRLIRLLCVVIVTVCGFAFFSHAVYHRSVMATLSEMYMIAVDRDEIYTAGNAYEENLKERAVSNLEEHTIPAGVHMSVDYRSVYEHEMQVIYFNEGCPKDKIIIYIPGGGYLNNPLKYHWKIINTLATKTNCTVLMPIYPKLPHYSCEESHKAMLEFYKDVATREGVEHIIFAGDSSGGGMSLALAQQLRDNYPELIQPEELLLIAPWMDVSMENEHISEYEPVDPMLELYGVTELGKMWAGELDVHDPKASPIYGTFENLGNITLFIGTRDMLCPDVLKFSEILNEQGIEHTLVVREGLDHPYPLFPTPEAKEAQEMMIDIINKI